MFDISAGEIGVIAVIAIVVVGPEKLPTVIKAITQTLRKLRIMTEGIKAEVSKELDLEGINSTLQDIKSSTNLNDITQEIRTELTTVSTHTEEAMRFAKDTFKASIEPHNLKHLAMNQPIAHLSFDDLDPFSKSAQINPNFNPNSKFNFENQEIDKHPSPSFSNDIAMDLSDEFEDDFSDFYAPNHTIHSPLHHANTAHPLRVMLAKRQTELCIDPQTPAALVQTINARYQNRCLLEAHELKESYHMRLSELSGADEPHF